MGRELWLKGSHRGRSVAGTAVDGTQSRPVFPPTPPPPVAGGDRGAGVKRDARHPHFILFRAAVSSLASADGTFAHSSLSWRLEG